MNQNITKTETEQLLNNIGMTMEGVYDIVKKGVANRFRQVSQLWGYDTVDDLVQSLMLYYLSPMKSTKEIRLNYYIKKYNDKKHLENQIRLVAYQWPICQARRKEIKNKPISFDRDFNVDSDDNSLAVIETIPDESSIAQVEDKLMIEDLINRLTELLNQLNLEALREKSKKDSLSFLIDMDNYIIVYNQTKIQLSLFKDLYYGYKRCELNKKYNNYSKHLMVLKNALSKIYTQYDMQKTI